MKKIAKMCGENIVSQMDKFFHLEKLKLNTKEKLKGLKIFSVAKRIWGYLIFVREIPFLVAEMLPKLSNILKKNLILLD